MNIKTQIIVAAAVIILLLVIVNMVRKKFLELRYALVWLLVGLSVLILDVCPGLMEKLSDMMGIETPANMLFFLGFCFALGIIFVLTVAVSRMSVRIKKIAQELALKDQENRK